MNPAFFVVRVLKLPDVNQFPVNTGVEVAPGSPADLARFVRSETDKYRKIIKTAGIEPQ